MEETEKKSDSMPTFFTESRIYKSNVYVCMSVHVGFRAFCRMRILITFVSVSVCICSLSALRHVNFLHLHFWGLMHRFMCLHALARLHQNKTDNWVLNEQQFPFVGAHYPCPLPLLYLTLAWGQLHSQHILPQFYPRICAINMHWLLF